MCLNTGYPCNCLTDGNPCEQCRMTAKDRETEEAHLSNNINAQGRLGSTCEPDLGVPPSGVVRERGRHWGSMLSGIICVNILILGCSLASGSAHNDVNIRTSDLQIYLIILLLLTSIWMIYYTIFTSRKENAVLYQDAHAGPIWLRGKYCSICFGSIPLHSGFGWFYMFFSLQGDLCYSGCSVSSWTSSR